MGTLGDFVGGFQGGYDFMTGARRDRQIEKAIDYELSDWERERQGKDKDLEAEGYDTSGLEAGGLKDPFLMRLINKFGGGQKQAVDPAAQAPMQSQAPAASTAAPGGSFMPQQGQGQPQDFRNREAFGAPPQQPGMYRDGGPVDEETANRYELYRPVMMANGGYMQPVSRALPPPPQPVVLADGGMPKRLTEEAKKQAKIEKRRLKADKKISKPGAKPKGGRKGFGKGKLMKGAGALVAASTAIDTYGTDTEDYYERFGMTPSAETNLGQFGQDVGVRTLGFASDLGSTLTGGWADRFFRDKQAQKRQAMPTGEPPPQAPAQAPVQAAPPPTAAQPAPRQAPPQAAPPVSEPQGFDWSSVSVPPDEIPSVPVKDWVAFRKAKIEALMLQGMTASEAHDEVTKIQQGGFIREAQSAFQFLQIGDAQSASRAMKAAYQYFPNGADVKFGMTKDEQGQPALIAMGTDEKTGESKGQPMLLNSERLATMMQNFSDPKSFTAWTKDWRDEAFKDKKYHEIDKPEAQSEADLRAARVGYLENKGFADILGATTGGALRQSDYDRAFKEFVGSQELRSLEDEAAAEYLASVMATMYANDPSLPYPVITYKVMEAYRDGTLEEKLAQFEAQ